MKVHMLEDVTGSSRVVLACVRCGAWLRSQGGVYLHPKLRVEDDCPHSGKTFTRPEFDLREIEEK